MERLAVDKGEGQIYTARGMFRRGDKDICGSELEQSNYTTN